MGITWRRPVPSDIGPRYLAGRTAIGLLSLKPMDAGEELSPWVFLSPEGLRWDERNLRRGFYRSLDKAWIRQVRFHDLRHTYASLTAEAGAPPKYVQKQLGHSSFQVTMDVYSHLFSEGNREWVAKLDGPAKPSLLHGEPATHPQPEAASVGAGSAK